MQEQRPLLRLRSGLGRPVAITFTAGYGAPADVPAAIRQAMLLLVTHWFTSEWRAVIDSVFFDLNEDPRPSEAGGFMEMLADG